MTRDTVGDLVAYHEKAERVAKREITEFESGSDHDSGNEPETPDGLAHWSRIVVGSDPTVLLAFDERQLEQLYVDLGSLMRIRRTSRFNRRDVMVVGLLKLSTNVSDGKMAERIDEATGSSVSGGLVYRVFEICVQAVADFADARILSRLC